ncbi:MAG: site-specific integrase [Saccharospirillaceae bacterium]|nr:site-specific integrase [Pseudomonadales bacterium]NRB81132.1 site-specific integrase [Saccharospirillaceae bacterium]
MSKSGQARVPTIDQINHLFDVIQEHRHPEKNTAIMEISFKLGLRVQEIALLQIKEIAKLNSTGTDFELNEVMNLPASYTKGANALNRSKTQYERKVMSFSKDSFDKIVEQITALAQAGVAVNPENFYPPVKKQRGKSRDLPMVDKALRFALTTHLQVLISRYGSLQPTSPVFVTQKGGAYSPNTLQEHMALMLTRWAGIEKGSSHSGRRALITDVIHKQNKSVKIAQKIAGHVNPSTTLIYDEPPEEAISDVLGNLHSK